MADDNVLGVRIQASGGGATAAELKSVEAQLRALRGSIQEAQVSAERMGFSTSGVVKALNQEAAALAETANALKVKIRDEQLAAAAAEQHASSIKKAADANRVFANELRHGVAAFDELARGQKGALFGTIGAALRDSGAGVGLLAGSVGILAGVMAGAAIVHGIENMGKWAQQVRSASLATGMSIENYSRMQAALELTGATATQADSSLRQLATSVERASANASSRAAKAWNALGVSQQQLAATGGDARKAFDLFVTAFNSSVPSINRTAAATAIMGENFEKIAPAVDKGVGGFRALEDKAQSLGMTLDNQTSAKLAEAAEKVDMLGKKLRGDGVQSMAAMADAIGHVADVLTFFIKEIGRAISAIGSLASSVGGLLSSAMHGPFIPGARGGTRRRTGEDIPLGWGASWLNRPHLDMDLDVTAKRNVPAFDVPKGSSAGAHKEFSAELAKEKTALEDLKRQHQLSDEVQDANFQRARLRARMEQGDREISPLARAQEEFRAYQQAGSQKIASLTEFATKSDAMYDRIAAKALQIYGKDSSEYQRAVGEKIAADREYEVQAQRIQNEILSHAVQLAEAHKTAVDQVVNQWGAAFDKIGDQIETTIGDAIKSAFIPMKPEYWWSSTSGPKGQPLMVPHRIDPTTQMFSQLGFSVLGDLGKQIGSSITTSLAKSMFGEGTSSFGAGIAKMIGIGTPGGLFGTGLGAVADIGKDATMATSVATFGTSVGVFTTAVGTFAASAGTSAAGSAAGAVGGAAGAAGGIGSFFSWIKGFLPFEHGGIVPSAAGGWALGDFSGATPALLHQREMVLPEHISQGLQDMIAGGGTGDMHMHFHGPADAQSIAKWFTQNLKQNSGAIVSMFRNSGLTPRAIS